jgi:hypothetical protein
MTKDLSLLLQHEGYVEAELYSPNMNFAEIMHFFRSEDVTSLNLVKNMREKKQSVELSHTKKVGNVNVDQHWEYPGRDVDWLCTCLKLYVLTILKELTATHQRTAL